MVTRIKTKAWKAYASAASAFIGSIVSSNFLPEPWNFIAIAVGAGLAAYIVPNPEKL